MLRVNNKKSITLRNRTNYFIPDKDKVKVTFSSPESYQSRQIKIEGYETRLYWQYRYCEEHQGQTFFYTLTYNDAAMPKHFGVNCFDYEDLRDLLTGGFRKQLLRKYGTKFKYFIGAELGDGKGSRGMHNNPHYHILFFLEDAENEKFPYKKISPGDFRHLVRLYWQGFDEATDGYRDYNEAKYGIAKEGENVGKVTDFRACCYVAKYVTKDVKLKANEANVEKKLKFQFRKEFRNTEESYREFFKHVIVPMYNTPTNPAKTEWCFTEVELIKELLGNDVFGYKEGLFTNVVEDMADESYLPYVVQIIKNEGLWQKYSDFVDSWISPRVKEGLNEWRNRYCNKCRISQGVGDYAMEHIHNKLNPFIQVPSKRGFKNRPINMYYYRKMFCDVVKGPEGNNLYVLNQDGIDYKVANLPKRMNKLISKCSSYLTLLLDNEKLFNEMRNSDINTEVFWTFKEFTRKMKFLLKDDNILNILKRYGEYKLVYEDRFFTYQQQGEIRINDFPPIDVIADYKRFLVPSFYSVSRNDLRLAAFLEDIPEDYLAYSQHPYFSRYIGIFSVLDMCADYFFIQEDNKKQKEAEERAATKRFHNQQRLKDFYSVFKYAS